MKITFNTPISLRDHGGNGYANVDECSLYFEPTFSGYRLNFDFTLETFKRENTVTLVAWEVDFYCFIKNQHYLMGRMNNGLQYNDFPIVLDGRGHSVKKIIDISTSDMVRLIDMSHRSEASFKFEAIPKFREQISANKEKGTCTIPHSEWLNFLNGMGLDRFELISIKIPISSSHLHKPFSDAVGKIREAERQYTKGDWNGSASSCRAAWRTILSATPGGSKAIEHLISPLSGDPKRKKFAEVLIKGLHDIENVAGGHLEGDQKAGTPPSQLEPEDALLCIHWYASVIGYLSSINSN